MAAAAPPTAEDLALEDLKAYRARKQPRAAAAAPAPPSAEALAQQDLQAWQQSQQQQAAPSQQPPGPSPFPPGGGIPVLSPVTGASAGPGAGPLGTPPVAFAGPNGQPPISQPPVVTTPVLPTGEWQDIYGGPAGGSEAAQRAGVTTPQDFQRMAALTLGPQTLTPRSGGGALPPSRTPVGIHYPAAPEEDALHAADKPLDALPPGLHGRVASPTGPVAALQTRQRVATAALAKKLPDLWSQADADRRGIFLRSVDLNRYAEQKLPYATPQEARAFQHARDQLVADATKVDSRFKQLGSYQKRVGPLIERYTDQPLHTGFDYPEEIHGQRPSVGQEFVDRFGKPLTAKARALAGFVPYGQTLSGPDAESMQKALNALMLTGELPPPVPLPQGISENLKQSLIQQKNNLKPAIEALWRYVQPDGTLKNFPAPGSGGASGLLNSPAVEQARQTLAGMTPWQRRILPTVRAQVLAGMKAFALLQDKTALHETITLPLFFLGAGLGKKIVEKAAGVGSEALLAAGERTLLNRARQYATTALGNRFGSTLAERGLAPAVQEALARHAVTATGEGLGGALGGAFAGGAATALAGGTPADVLRSLPQGAKSGAQLAGGFFLAHRIVPAYRAARAAFTSGYDPVRTPLYVNTLAESVGKEHNLTDADVAHLKARLTEIAKAPPVRQGALWRRLAADAGEVAGSIAKRTVAATSRGAAAYTPPGAATTAPPAGPTAAPGPKTRATKTTPAPAEPPASRADVVTTATGEAIDLRHSPIAKLEGYLNTLPADDPARAAVEAHLFRTSRYAESRKAPVSELNADEYLKERQKGSHPVVLHEHNLEFAAKKIEADLPADAALLREGAAEWQTSHRHEFVTHGGEMGHPDVGTTKPEQHAPPTVSVWRRLSDAAKARLTKEAKTSLLLQDIDNSRRVLDPTAKAVRRFTDLPGKPNSNAKLEVMAETLHGQAQQAAGAAYHAETPPPVPTPASEPSTATAAATPSEPPAQPTGTVPAPEVQPIVEPLVAAPEAVPGGVERRQAGNAPERQRISEITDPKALKQELAKARAGEVTAQQETSMEKSKRQRDKLTGLGSKDAWAAVPKKRHIAAIDVDSLKWVNEQYGHAGGDALLKEVGRVLRQAGLKDDAFHPTGDEYWAHGDDAEKLRGQVERANDLLSRAKIAFKDADGVEHTLSGFSLTHGLAETVQAADELMGAEKVRRERAGLRAPRGEQPVNFVNESETTAPLASKKAKEAAAPTEMVQSRPETEAGSSATRGQQEKPKPIAQTGEVVAPEPPKAQKSLWEKSLWEKSLWEMSLEELHAAHDYWSKSDRDLEEEMFGVEGAQRYRQLQRRANNLNAAWETTRAASDQIEQMEATLTKPEQDRLFGVGEAARANPEDIQEYIRAVGGLDPTSAADLGDSLKYALTKVGQETDPAKMTHKQQVAYATLREGFRIARREGFDTGEVTKAAIKGAASRFKDPEDAALMLRRYLKDVTGMAEKPKPGPALSESSGSLEQRRKAAEKQRWAEQAADFKRQERGDWYEDEYRASFRNQEALAKRPTSAAEKAAEEKLIADLPANRRGYAPFSPENPNRRAKVGTPAFAAELQQAEQGRKGGETPRITDEKPIPKGMTRLYRITASGTATPKELPAWLKEHLATSGSTAAGGRWFTHDPALLDWYIRQALPDKAVLTAIDVPNAVAEQHRVANLGPEVKGHSRDHENEFFLPPELAKQAVPWNLRGLDLNPEAGRKGGETPRQPQHQIQQQAKRQSRDEEPRPLELPAKLSEQYANSQGLESTPVKRGEALKKGILRIFHALTRQFEDLPEIAHHEKFMVLLRARRNARSIAQVTSIQVIERMFHNMHPIHVENVSKAFYVKGMEEDIAYQRGLWEQTDQSEPFTPLLPEDPKTGVAPTEAEVAAAAAAVDKHYATDPFLKEDIATVQRERAKILDPWLEQFQAVHGWKPDLKRVWYMRHQFLATQARELGSETGAAGKAGQARGKVSPMQGRVGSELPYNSHLIETELEWMGIAIRHTIDLELVDHIDKNYNELPAQLAARKELNQAWVDTELRQVGGGGTVSARLHDLLAREAYQEQLPDRMDGKWAKVLADLAARHEINQGLKEIGRSPLTDAVPGTDAYARYLVDLRARRSKLPVGHKTTLVEWDPSGRPSYYWGFAIPERIALEAMTKGLESIGLTKEQIRKTLMVGRSRKMLIPAEVKATLEKEGVGQPDTVEHMLQTSFRAANAVWKAEKLYSPFHAVGQFTRNAFGDTMNILRDAAPSFARFADWREKDFRIKSFALQAARDVLGNVYGGRPPSEGLALYDRLGGEAANQYVQEGLPTAITRSRYAKYLPKPEPAELSKVQRFMGARRLPSPSLAQAGRLYHNVIRGPHEVREKASRLSVFLYMKDHIDRTGFPPTWGRSNPKQIMALIKSGDTDRAAFELTSDLVGHYGRRTAMTEFTRKYLFTFPSFPEIQISGERQRWVNALHAVENRRLMGKQLLLEGKVPLPVAKLATTSGALATTLAGATAATAAFAIWNTIHHAREMQALQDMAKGQGKFKRSNMREWAKIALAGSPFLITGPQDPKTGEIPLLFGLDNNRDMMNMFFGIDQYFAGAEDVANGRKSGGQLAWEMTGQNWLNQFYQQVGPLHKIRQTLTLKEYPNMFKATPQRDPVEAAFDTLSLGPVWRAIRNEAQTKRHLGLRMRTGSVMVDPLESSYREAIADKEAWLDAHGQGGGGGDIGGAKKAYAMYQVKQAVRVGDHEHAAYWLGQYAAENGTMKTLHASLEGMDPLRGVSEKSIRPYLDQLEPARKARLRRAYQYYVGLISPAMHVPEGGSDVAFITRMHQLMKGEVKRDSLLRAVTDTSVKGVLGSGELLRQLRQNEGGARRRIMLEAAEAQNRMAAEDTTPVGAP